VFPERVQRILDSSVSIEQHIDLTRAITVRTEMDRPDGVTPALFALTSVYPPLMLSYPLSLSP